MDYDNWYRRVLDVLPEAEVGKDNDGQLVIYTNLRAVSQSGILFVIPFEVED